MVINVLGLALYGPLAASTRYRLGQYVSGLRAYGIHLEVEALLGDEYVRSSYAGENYPLRYLAKDYVSRAARLLLKQRQYDVAIINAELFPLLPGFIESRALRIPFIYDFDDAFFLKYRLPRFKHVSFLLRDKLNPLVARAAAVTAGNSYLADFARPHNANTHVLPTVVDTERYRPNPNTRPDVFTIGWIGSPSTSVYLSELSEALSTLGREGPVRFVVVGGHAMAIAGVEVVNVPWSEATEVELINTFDIGVMPLFDDEWARGKCAFKLIQYMACGVPVVASAVGANMDVVTPSCGLLAADSAGWLAALRQLREDPQLRTQMGHAGRARVEQSYSLASALPLMAGVIARAAEESSRGG
jgi:glycosyltransferase involved in cell wall biosynthesis